MIQTDGTDGRSGPGVMDASLVQAKQILGPLCLCEGSKCSTSVMNYALRQQITITRLLIWDHRYITTDMDSLLVIQEDKRQDISSKLGIPVLKTGGMKRQQQTLLNGTHSFSSCHFHVTKGKKILKK